MGALWKSHRFSLYICTSNSLICLCSSKPNPPVSNSDNLEPCELQHFALCTRPKACRDGDRASFVHHWTSSRWFCSVFACLSFLCLRRDVGMISLSPTPSRCWTVYQVPLRLRRLITGSKQMKWMLMQHTFWICPRYQHPIVGLKDTKCGVFQFVKMFTDLEQPKAT